MENYTQLATGSTPEIHLNPLNGEMLIRGESYPENTFEFYRPVIAWIRTFLADSSQPASLKLELVYLNTGSVKCMMDIFDLFEDAHQEGRKVCVNWRYHAKNPRSLETAEEFKEDLTFPFEIESFEHE